MYRALLALLFSVFTLVGCSSQTISTVVAPSVSTIGADELKRMVDNGEDFVLVDVREAQELEAYGTLKNHKHIPIGQLEQRMSEIPKDKKVVVACQRGARAGRGAALLQRNGYKSVVSTGMAEYKAKGYELIYPKLSR